MSVYTSWKQSVLGQKLDIDKQYGDQCVDVDLSYGQALFPGVSWNTVFPPTAYAKDLGATHNPTYFDWVVNNHSDVNQLPSQGHILVFGPTPASGYSNPTNNPAGHTGVVDSATSSGYTIIMQDGINPGGVTFEQSQPWKFRPALGWLVPKTASAPAPPPAPTTGHTIFLPPTTGPWHAYPPDGPYTYAAAKGLLYPSQFGGLTYDIVVNKGNGVYVINTQDFGQAALWTNGSDVTIT